MSPKKANSAAQNNESTSELIEDKKKLMALIDRAQDGDKDALPVLRRVLDEEPRIARFVDLARDVERSIVKRCPAMTYSPRRRYRATSKR